MVYPTGWFSICFILLSFIQEIIHSLNFICHLSYNYLSYCPLSYNKSIVYPHVIGLTYYLFYTVWGKLYLSYTSFVLDIICPRHYLSYSSFVLQRDQTLFILQYSAPPPSLFYMFSLILGKLTWHLFCGFSIFKLNF